MRTYFGIVLRELRKRRGLTLQQVASALGVTYPAVQQWETGTTIPNMDRIKKLGELLKAELFHIPYNKTDEELPTDRLEQYIKTATSSFESNLNWREEGALLGRYPEIYVKYKSDEIYLVKEKEDILKSGFDYQPSQTFIPIEQALAIPGGPDFELTGSIIDLVLRPPGLRHTSYAFGIYVPVEAMSPRYNIGEIIFLDSFRSISVNDYAVYSVDHPNMPSRDVCQIGQVVHIDEEMVVLRHISPHRIFTFRKPEIIRYYRILTPNDLFQVEIESEA